MRGRGGWATFALIHGSSTCFSSVFSVALMRPPHLTSNPLLFTFFTPRKPYRPNFWLRVLFLINYSMEIDFMGLYSKNPSEQNGYDPDAFVDSGIGSTGASNVSLSLCASSPMDEKTVFQDFLRKKIRKPPAENMISIRNSAGKYDWENAQLGEGSCPSFTGKPIISHSGFPYNRNDDRATISRNTFERTLSFPAASSTVFCPIAAPNMFPAQKANGKMYATGDASFDGTRKSKHGYTPTVAMARKATLARFLEKRSHRLNQQIKPHLMGRSLNWDTTFTKHNKKIKSSMQLA